MHPPRALLFDLGDTLVDFKATEEALHAAYGEVRGRIEAAAYVEMHELLDMVERAAAAVDRLVAASYAERRMAELDIAAVLAEALAEVGFELPRDVIDHVVALQRSAYARSLTVEPEILEVLRGLSVAGYRMGLVSNTGLAGDLMRRELATTGIAVHLDDCVFSSEVGYRKPDPGIFQAALAGLGASADETVFVGDRLLDDVVGPRSVGLRAVLTHQFRLEQPRDTRPDAVIRDMRELAAIVEGWGGDAPCSAPSLG